MARPQDMERVATFIEAQKADRDRYATDPSESIFTTKARELQKTRRNALLGIKAGDREPLGRYRDELGIYKAYLHLGNHLLQWEAAGMMLAEVGADRTDEQIADALVRHEDGIDALRRGALR